MGKTIIHIMGMDSTKYGGLERYNVALAAAVSAAGHRIVFVYESMPQVPQFVGDLDRAGAALEVCPSRGSKADFCIKLRRLLLHYKPSIVHAHFTKARFYALPLAKACGVKQLFCTIHGELGDAASIKPWTRLWYKWAGRRAQVLAVSEAIKSSYLHHWPGARVQCLYLGIKAIGGDRAACRQQLGLPEHAAVAVCVANFNHIKGLDNLVEAVEVLKKQDALPPDVLFCIVGQPEADRRELQASIDAHGLASHFRLEGISNNVPDYLRAADLYLQPSRSEGLPLSLMEAASCGLPIVATRVGGIPEVVKDNENGLLVPPENAAMLADAILTMLSDGGLRQQYGRRSADIFHSQFELSKSVQQLLALYRL